MPRRRVLNRLVRLLGAVDTGLNRLYGSRANPLYQSGALASALLAVLLVTGVYLLLVYRVSAPYESVRRLTADPWLGRWMRGVHRYASDLALLAALWHALRMFAQRRTWGRRILPWVSGLLLVAALLASGWTGYVMVWDTFGQLLASQGARVLDLVPIFSEPLGRAFIGERPMPEAFFFLNLFLHIALPIGLGVLLWLHVSRVARPVLAPPRALRWIGLTALIALAVLMPVEAGEPAHLFHIPPSVRVDLWYAFWIPAAYQASPWWVLGSWLGAIGLLLLVPRWTRPRAGRPAPSDVDERLCTGCEQCALDCPYEAIAMRPRAEARGSGVDLVAHVEPDVCVSCGICAGSCAPMGVGPPGRTGRDQLSEARGFLARFAPKLPGLVLIGCSRSAAGGLLPDSPDIAVFPMACVGGLHTSVIEYFLRSGVPGVLVVACPRRDCWNREGAIWLEQRLYFGREAELQDRVDRTRLRTVELSLGQASEVARAIAEFRSALRQGAEGPPPVEDQGELARECDTETVQESQ